MKVEGIMPSLKTSIISHEQTKQHDRRKTGDLLKEKIQQRPRREELIRQHILEDIGHIDPSLAERQRMLKKARLADQLNDQLSHRPGPLELIQKNILHTEEPIERAIKEGHIFFKATSEGQLTKPQHPNQYISFEDDSSKSEEVHIGQKICAATSLHRKSDDIEQSKNYDIFKTPAIKNESLPANNKKIVIHNETARGFENSEVNLMFNSMGTSKEAEIDILQQLSCSNYIKQEQKNLKNPVTICSTSGSLSKTSIAISSTSSSLALVSTNINPLGAMSENFLSQEKIDSKTQNNMIVPSLVDLTKSEIPGKDKNRKKSKAKSQSKTKTIKFHEYKGPPSAQKLGTSSPMTTSSRYHETSYELLLQQQQLFLQWQVEFKNKFPQLILPATEKTTSIINQNSESSIINCMNINASTLGSKSSKNFTENPPVRLLGKLEDMKVSDLKVELKRRSLPVSGSKPQLIERLKSFKETIKTTLLDSNKNLSTLENDKLSSNQDSKEKKNEKFDTTKKDLKNDSTLSGNFQDNLIQCRKKIVELHSELNKINSQKYLQSNYSIRSEKLVLQQHLQNKLHHQNLSKQLNHLQQLQQLSDQQSKTQTTRLHLLQTGTNSSSIHDSIITEKKNQKNQNNYETTLQMPTAIVLNLAKPTKLSESILEALVAQVQNQQPVKTSKAETVTSNKYDEAAKLLKVKIEPLKKKTISSQMVDDVLEILISSGELPPTAANEILTTMVPNKNLMPNSNLERDNKDITRSSAVMTDNTPKNFHKKNNINSYSTLSSSDFQQLNTTAELTVSSCSAGSNFKEISNIKRNHLKSEPQSSTFIPAPLVTATTKVPITLQKVQIEKHENQCDLMNETARQLNFELNNQTNTLIESQPRKHFTTDYQHPQEIISPGQPNIDFEVLGEDLNTMDFYQLDCDFEVKMEAQQELMDIVDVSMDMDEANWLETLLPQSSSSLIIPTVTDQTTQNENIFNSSSQKHANLFDPLLSENPDSLDVFNVEFSDFKT